MSLLPHHREMLRASGLSDDVIQQRGYDSTHKKNELRGLGFTNAQLQTVSAEKPALLIPVFQAGRTDPVFCQIRPDVGRVRDGKSVKYEMPPNTRMVVDVPPGAREWIGG